MKGINKKAKQKLTLQKVVSNAYKMYYKTRPLASSESVKRAKEMTISHLHPLFESQMSSTEIEQTKFVESLKKFRPPQTILELKAKNSKNHQANTSVQSSTSNSFTASDIMKVKRFIHGSFSLFFFNFFLISF